MLPSLLLEFDHVSLRRGKFNLLDQISWRVATDQHWLILGPNGAGKSSLVTLLMADLWPSQGSIRILGEAYQGNPIKKINQRISLYQPVRHAVTQMFYPEMSVLDVILSGLDDSRAPIQQYSVEQKSLAHNILEEFFSTQNRNFAGRSKWAHLSTGERHQVLLLRCFIRQPRLLVLDEPFESLDIKARYQLEYLLYKQVKKHHTNIIIILHRVEEIPSFLTHALLLKKGQVFLQGPIEKQINSENLSEIYEMPLTVQCSQKRYHAIASADFKL